MSYGFEKEIRWNYFDFFQDNNEADETLKVRHSNNYKNVFLHIGEAVLLRKDPVNMLNIVAPSKQFQRDYKNTAQKYSHTYHVLCQNSPI